MMENTSDTTLYDSSAKWAFLALLCLGVICSMTPWFSATAILPELKTQWQVSNTMGAFLTNAVQVGFVIGALFASVFNLPDVFSPARLMSIGAALAGVFTLLIAVTHSVEIVAFLRFATGIALAFVYPPAMKLATTWFVKGRGLCLGLVIGALTLGSAMPHLVRAFLTDVDWKLVVMTAGFLSIMGAVIFAKFIHEGPFPYAVAKFELGQIGKVFTNRPVALANMGYFGHMWELYAMWAWFLVFTQHAITQQHAFFGDPHHASMIVFCVIASGVIGAVLGGVLADRIGRTWTTAMMMMVSGSCSLLIGFLYAGPFPLFLLVAIIWGITVIGDSAQFSAMVTEVADRHLVGTALTLQMGIGFLITILSIQLLPVYVDFIGGWQWSFTFLVPGPLLGTLAVLRLRQRPESLQIAQGLR